MARKKTPPANKATTTALANITGSALVPLFGSERALTKMPGNGGAVVRDGDVTLVTGRPYATDGRVIPASEIFFVNGAKPNRDGPWIGEADKLSWVDDETGFECIMLRETGDGYLSGFVGVPCGHPLWGWNHEAIPTDLGIDVHGGLTYSRICDEGPEPTRRIAVEARRICHVPRVPYQFEPISHATDHRPEDAHVWWFGFDCNHLYDVIPGETRHGLRFLGAETGAKYRDDGYVVREVINLARQLRAIADREPVPEREGPPPPPIGLDPQRGG
jgi:hypothetical protein